MTTDMLWLEDFEVFAPRRLGRGHVLAAGGKICGTGPLEPPPKSWDVTVIRGDGRYLVPGFIDPHVHIAGAGGEGGPVSRTPEIQPGQLIRGGVTSVVGCLGTDGIARRPESVLMKAKGLRQHGLGCWMYTGSYQVPTPTIFSDAGQDLCFLDEVIGVGEIALADHRSSSPTVQELVRLAKLTRVGGMLGQKAGIVHLHMGDGRDPFAMVEAAVAASELGYGRFYPTHTTRNAHIFEAAKDYGKRGPIDITTSSYPYFPDEEVKPSQGVVGLLQAGVPLSHITFSSDAGGSLPRFDQAGQLVGMQVGEPSSNLREIRDLVQGEGVSLEDALTLATTNPARILKLRGKGELGAGFDADMLILEKDLSLHSVIAGGKVMLHEGRLLAPGPFEA